MKPRGADTFGDPRVRLIGWWPGEEQVALEGTLASAVSGACRVGAASKRVPSTFSSVNGPFGTESELATARG